MSFRTKTPGEGNQGRAFHNVHLKTPNGAQWYAHMAGKPLWLECHTKGYSKPCLHWITRGELVCKRCNPLDPKEDLGYIPVYREKDGKPGFVIVKDYARDIVDRLAVHQRVLISRGPEKSDGLSVVAAVGGRTYHSSREDFMRPVDLTMSLLRLFKLPELTAWYFRTQFGKEAPAETETAEPVTSTGEEFGPMTKNAARRFSADQLTEGIGNGGDRLTNDQFADQVRGTTKPSSNGKHKPKG